MNGQDNSEKKTLVFGSACTPVVDSCQCMAKPIQYYKVKIKILKIKNLKIKKDTCADRW